MSIILDTLRSYTSRANNHKSPNGTNNIVYNQRVCGGIAYVQGDNSDDVTISITFPFTFDDITDMRPQVTFVGARATTGGVPTDIGDFTTKFGVAINVATEDVTTTGMTITLDTTSTNFSSNFYFGVSWEVKGTYNDYD